MRWDICQEAKNKNERFGFVLQQGPSKATRHGDLNQHAISNLPTTKPVQFHRNGSLDHLYLMVYHKHFPTFGNREFPWPLHSLLWMMVPDCLLAAFCSEICQVATKHWMNVLSIAVSMRVEPKGLTVIYGNFVRY